MKRMKDASSGRVMTAGAAAAVLLAGLGLLLYSVFGGASPRPRTRRTRSRIR